MFEDDAGMSSGMNPDDFVVTEEYLLSTQSNYRTRPFPATAASLPKSSTTTRATSTSSTTTTTSKMATSKATTVKTSATPVQDPLILPTQRGPVTSNTVEAQPINDFSNVLNILVPALIALIIAVSILKGTQHLSITLSRLILSYIIDLFFHQSFISQKNQLVEVLA